MDTGITKGSFSKRLKRIEAEIAAGTFELPDGGATSIPEVEVETGALDTATAAYNAETESTASVQQMILDVQRAVYENTGELQAVYRG